MRLDDHPTNTNHDDEQLHPLWGRLALLMFGLTVLAFLTAIDRADRFDLKAAAGTRAAMAYASDRRS